MILLDFCRLAEERRRRRVDRPFRAEAANSTLSFGLASLRLAPSLSIKAKIKELLRNLAAAQ
jgi:hypothetical protein